ncbi:hypothetical protein ACFFJI_10310 [Allobacillus sp. GCM10007491]|uniref:Uncharacterized protein n=1 Tax=Allobacillus saliphilus TaxID=2912308 RepID=A0A941CRL9_9BACI|nr:hypothetical protein [Allobacillus saliphilus]MBR7552617.1 hypothetical protein [Allobacillus saliphilus]
MIEWIFFFLMGMIILFFFSRFLGFKKENIGITFDQRYIKFEDYVHAILDELANKNYEAKYIGDRTFQVDGQKYVLVERNVKMGGAPLQQTMLKKMK